MDEANPAALTRKDFASSQSVRWCPGCGDYAILAQVQQTLPKLGIPRENFVVISGIGCSSRFPYYINTYGSGFDTTLAVLSAGALATGLAFLLRARTVGLLLTALGSMLSLGLPMEIAPQLINAAPRTFLCGNAWFRYFFLSRHLTSMLIIWGLAALVVAITLLTFRRPLLRLFKSK